MIREGTRETDFPSWNSNQYAKFVLFVYLFASFLNLRMLLWAFGLRNSGGRVTKYSMLMMKDFTMPVVIQDMFLLIIRIRGWYYVCGRNCRKSTNQTAASDRAVILNVANRLVSTIFLQIQWFCLFVLWQRSSNCNCILFHWHYIVVIHVIYVPSYVVLVSWCWMLKKE